MDHESDLKKWLFSLLFICCAGGITTAQQQPVKLLIRGDDMGKDYGRTLGIIKAHQEGILTSASIMPNSAYFDECVRLCKENPDLAAGLHLTLFGTRQRPVLSPEQVPSLVTAKGFFYEGVGEMEKANVQFDPEEVEKEIRAQIGKARASGLHFVYLDWHRGVPDMVIELVRRICKEQQLVFAQDFDGSVNGYPRVKLIPESWPSQELPDGQKAYYATPPLNDEDRQFYYDALNKLEPGQWMAAVHPGLADPQRASVTEFLCDPEAREIFRRKNIQLVSYMDIWEEQFGQAQTHQAGQPLLADPPNFVVVFADDLGYGDLGIFGHPTIRTPHIDQMAYQGQKWTNFYVAAPVCTPSRAGLLTGRLPIRSGMCSDKRRVLFPDSNGGLPQSEISIARVLSENGYRTAAVGKWHLGHKSPYLPTDHGFESYFGIPYSNDMNKTVETAYFTLIETEPLRAYNVPLMRDDRITERPADQRTLTKRYTEEAVSKIRSFKGEPFFIYLAHSMPHIPLFRSGDFKDKSLAGIYGDVIEEIDWSVGQILKTLKEEGLAENTLVVLTSDNGPWHIFKTHGGSAGLLRGAKGGTFEGGMREPTVFWWPGSIKPGVVMDIATTMDLMPTFCNLAGIELPGDRVYDGYDISPLMFGTGRSRREVVFYYRGEQVYAIRKGHFKAHFITQLEYGTRTAHFNTDPEVEIERSPVVQDPPLLYNLSVDPSEKYNISGEHPEIVAEIRQILNEHLAGIEPVVNQLER